MQSFENVDVWKKAHALVLRVYQATDSLPREEAFGITMQLRRSAIAVAMRIAEGSGRGSNIDFAVDLRRAAASCNELEYLMLLTRDLRLWSPDVSGPMMADTVEVRKMLFGLMRSFNL